MKFALPISLALHLVLVFVLKYVVFERPKKTEFVEVSFTTNNQKSGSNKIAGKSLNLIAKRFVPTYDYSLSRRSTTGNGVVGVSETPGDTGYWQGDLSQNALNTPFVKGLWQRINYRLIYPKDFIDQEIKGAVTATVVVDKRGVLKDLVSVETPQIFLELFIASYVYQILQFPLPTRLWLNSEEDTIKLTLHFYFHITAGDVIATQDLQFIQRSLIFERVAPYEGRINKAIRQAWDKYVPPVIPIPGGFYVDFVTLYKLVMQLSGEPTEEELREKRLKILKEELERTRKPS